MSGLLTLGALALIVGASLTLGGLALARLPTADLRRYERLSLELTAGLGLTALLLSLAALAGRLDIGILLLVPIAVPGLIGLIRVARGFQPRVRGPERAAPRELGIAGLAVAASAFVACLGAIAPVTDDDALAYVVPIARHIARSGRLQVWSDQARSMWPLSHEVLLAAIMRLGGDRLGALSALEWLLAVGTVSALARRVCERESHVPWAIALAIASPVAAFQVAAAKEDLLVDAATAAAAFCLAGKGTLSELATAGLFAGIAAGAKYPGIGVAAATVTWIAVSKRDRRIRGAAVAAVSAAAAGGLWYALNLWRFGNPVAPLIWGAAGTPIDAPTVREFVDGYGSGRSVWSFVVTPVRLFVEPALYCGRAALFHPLTYVGVAIMWSAQARRRHAALLFIAAVLYVGWFFTLQNVRLLLPASTLLAPAAADCLTALRGRHWRPLAVAAIALPLVLPPAVGVLRAARLVRYGPAFLDRESRHYADIRWANAHLDPARDRIASVYRPIAYFEIPAIVLDPTHQFEIASSELGDPQRLIAACRRQGITHLFTSPDIDPAVASQLRLVYQNPASRLGGVRFFRDSPSEPTAIFAIGPALSSVEGP